MARKTTQVLPDRVLDRDHLAEGIKILDRRIADLKSFDLATIAQRWDPRVNVLERKVASSLAEIFGEGSPEHRRHTIGSLENMPVNLMGHNYAPAVAIQENIRGNIVGAVATLESVKDLLAERLERVGGTEAAAPLRPAPRPIGRDIFIVHGQDEAAKQMVARFVEQLGCKAVILHEQPNSGRTIIEKLEQHLGVDFAIVLLTPDDIGGLAADPGKQKHRARQNVVMELGLFIGALGRGKVCALRKGDLETPSDFSGVVYVAMDDAGGWKYQVAKEMRQAGLAVDMNLL